MARSIFQKIGLIILHTERCKQSLYSSLKYAIHVISETACQNKKRWINWWKRLTQEYGIPSCNGTIMLSTISHNKESSCRISKKFWILSFQPPAPTPRPRAPILTQNPTPRPRSLPPHDAPRTRIGRGVKRFSGLSLPKKTLRSVFMP